MTREQFMSLQFYNSDIIVAIAGPITKVIEGWDHKEIGIRVTEIQKEYDEEKKEEYYRLYGVILTTFKNPDGTTPEQLVEIWNFQARVVGVKNNLGEHVVQDGLRINQIDFIPQKQREKIAEEAKKEGKFLSDAQINDITRDIFCSTKTFDQIRYEKRLKDQIDSLNQQSGE